MRPQVAPAALLVVGAALAVVAFHLWITPENPPGFHRDGFSKYRRSSE